MGVEEGGGEEREGKEMDGCPLTVRGHLSISLPYLFYSPPTPVPIPIVDDLGILKSTTLTSSLRSHLSHIGQSSDTWGHVHAILQHPLRHVDSW
jgi:hypothetical protein